MSRIGTGKYALRRLCRVLGLRRASIYAKRSAKPVDDDATIAEKLHEVTQAHIAWGFWLVYCVLRQQGHKWNHKRVYRIWKAEKLNLRQKPHKPVLKRVYRGLLAPDRVNEGWAMDFVSEWVVGPVRGVIGQPGIGSRQVRLLNIMDECSRKALWTEAHTSIPSTTLTAILDKVAESRGGYPKYIRCDNGPEFISEKLAVWATTNSVEIRFIQPGKPTQNGLIERLNQTVRKECLNLQWFTSLEHLNDCLQTWWQTYNFERPHSSIGKITPDQFELLPHQLYFRSVTA